jgi:hypothetical protein
MQSGKLTLVMTTMVQTRIPLCTPAITSETVDIPTVSAPINFRKRVSAGVSRLGPVRLT